MAKPLKPLKYDTSRPPVDVRFKDFGVLDAGSQSKTSVATAIVLNGLALAFVIAVGYAAKNTIEETHQVTLLTAPVLLQPAPKPLPPPPLPKPPAIKEIEPPKIKLSATKAPEIPKPTPVKMAEPTPVVTPAPPRRVVAPAAPKAVSLAHPSPASVVNHSPHPTAVALGRPDNPIAPSNRPATAAVNLGQHGMPGMPAENSGGGPRTTQVNLGSGSPGSRATGGYNGVRAVAGIPHGVPGGTGPNNSTGREAGQVNLGQNVQPAVRSAVPTASSVQRAPRVLYKPTPVYTAEATALHLSGEVAVRIRVSATGTVTVLGITSALGHGLDQSAERAVQGTRFSPALDVSGRPVDWEGVVRVNFQLAG
ncbi:MAG TPA: energy transducer TonB [Granulicella sp.]|nr:energy transducer TonB [Granulicella sp.]